MFRSSPRNTQSCLRRYLKKMKTKTTIEPRELHDAIDEATNFIGALYPLKNFIACNALKGLERIPFPAAMRKATELFGAKGFLPLSHYRAMYESGRIEPADLEDAFRRHQCPPVHEEDSSADVLTFAESLDQISNSRIVTMLNKQMVKWCAAYLDRTQAQWAPQNKDGLYSFWKELARYDLSLSFHGVTSWSDSVNSLPEHSHEALETLLRELGVDDERISAYLRRHVIQMPGFVSHLKWCQSEKLETEALMDYFAIRLHYEKMLCQVTAKRLYRSTALQSIKPLVDRAVKCKKSNEAPEPDDYAPVWQEAYELNYRDRLLDLLTPGSVKEADTASCQLVFCIDVRSEPIRRELERRGPYSTYGFAGFFGMPMKLTELGSAMSVDLCPVLLKPEKSVTETADKSTLARKTSWQALGVSALHLKKKLKSNLAGAFGLVELLGIFSAVPLAMKTFFPSITRRLWDELQQKVVGDATTKLELSAFSDEDKVALAEGALKGIGLTYFGKVIVLCGHRSSTVNNHFASSLDCGACGGSGGGFSARLAASILNDRKVREGLCIKGIKIPAYTRFIAAEHDTTMDQFRFLDCETLSEEQMEILGNLKEDLRYAGQAVRKVRAQTLPACSRPNLDDPLERASDWAQIAPEWGLAGNAAFIAGPRTLTKHADLKGRVFLHSYEFSDDSDCKVLELIMTAPLVVAQWINMQYYLSTVDNETFGSGSKVLHNVAGDFGVMQGAASDLKMGLPLQSIATAQGLAHEPMRLLAVINAPVSAIDAVLKKHCEVRNLVANRWIRLVALDPDSAEFYEAEDCGRWRKIKPKSENSTEKPGLYLQAENGFSGKDIAQQLAQKSLSSKVGRQARKHRHS